MKPLSYTAIAFLALNVLVLPEVQLFAQSDSPKVTTDNGKVIEERKASNAHESAADAGSVIRTYRLVNTTQTNDANEILITLRNMLSPSERIFMDFSASTIAIVAPPEQQQIAQNLIAKLDIVKPTYRLTYTLTELEDGKRIGTQHYTLTATDGQRVSLKQGSKIPLATSSDHQNPQFQYIDVGMNFSVQAYAVNNGVQLQSKVEQSSVPEDKTIAGVQEPVIRQAVLEGASVVQFGKPFILGSMDVVGSTRRIDIEVVAEPINYTSAGH